MTGYIHAENMALFAKDASDMTEPWLRWDIKNGMGCWKSCTHMPTWARDSEYRRKPRTITINGFTIVAPIRRELNRGDEYFVPRMHHQRDVLSHKWRARDSDYHRLYRGLIHLTPENAKAHSIAVISLTKDEDYTCD